MSNRLCPKCGEEYSDTYKKCPFCQEEEAIRQGRPLHRHSGRRESRRQSGGAGGVLLLVTGVMLLGIIGLLFFGDHLTDAVGIRGDTSKDPLPQQDSSEDPPAEHDPVSDPEEKDDPPASVPPTPPSGGQTGSNKPGAEAVVPPLTITPGPLALSQSDITIAAGDTALLTASGGSGDVVWSSSNENIAAVEGGSVTGKAGGKVTITAACGEETASCTVNVTGDPWVSTANLSLNRTDFTLNAGNPTFQMEVKGTDSAAVWTSSNPSAATVSDTGVVTRVGGGNATITAAVDGQELTCIVRCGKA